MFTTTLSRGYMITNQLDRLKQDCNELEYFIQRLMKEGNDNRVQKIQKKKQYLEEYIQQMQMTPVAEIAA
jgi:hypothetical protein